VFGEIKRKFSDCIGFDTTSNFNENFDNDLKEKKKEKKKEKRKDNKDKSNQSFSKKILVCEENKVGVRCEFSVEREIGLGVILDGEFKGKCGDVEKKSECKGLKGSNCDGFIYYQSENKKNAIFVELKGSDLEKAVEQILNSIKNFKNIFPKHNHNYNLGAVIVYTGSTPTQTKTKTLKKLNKELDKNLKPAYTQTIKGKADITEYVKK